MSVRAMNTMSNANLLLLEPPTYSMQVSKEAIKISASGIKIV